MNDMSFGIGHNSAPIIPAEIVTKVSDFTDAAGAWLDLKEIDSQERSEKATDFVAGARAVFKEVDEARKTAKKPHDDAAQDVQDAFKPLLDKIGKAGEVVKALQAAWLKKEKAREYAEQRAREAAARAEKAAADRALAEAQARNDVSGMVDAEAAQKAAAKDVKAASKPVKAQASSATGGGRTMSLRTTYRCQVENRGPALAAYRDHPEVIALIERLATADVRAQRGEKIAPTGFKLITEETAA